jgi:hypothetical protein
MGIIYYAFGAGLVIAQGLIVHARIPVKAGKEAWWG